VTVNDLIPPGGDPVENTVAGIAYRTAFGTCYQGLAEELLTGDLGGHIRGHVNLILTSPPFMLNNPKRYGNLKGEAYLEWFADFATIFSSLLSPDGSIVIELGHAWEPGRPVMSTLPLRALLRFLEAGTLNLCEEFVCYNPARLPSPAQWVTIERIRVKDAYTHVWWMSPSDRPSANNRRVLKPYRPHMRKVFDTGSYSVGKRPSGHDISRRGFLRDNGGAIPGNVITLPATQSNTAYLRYCRDHHLQPHPARMVPRLAAFFIAFLTQPGDLVVDPFAGSNTTGAAAEGLGRRWIAIEPRADYITGSRGRFLTAV
jgi:hypothetical protein